MNRSGMALALLAVAAPAAAAPITVAKSTAAVSDGVNTVGPKVLPGGTVEVTLVATNPLLNPSTIGNVTICDDLTASTTLLTSDLTPNAGPLSFTQGVTASGLSYRYISLASTTDGLALYDAGGALIATPSAGSDARVRKVCATLTGTQMAGGGSFQLRYQVLVR